MRVDERGECVLSGERARARELEMERERKRKRECVCILRGENER